MSNKPINITRKVKKYFHNREGATAIEFGILAMPFAALIFAILELAIVFFITATMAHATGEVSREIRTGQFQKKCRTAEQFKSDICDKMYGLGNCSKYMRVDVMTAPPDGQFSAQLMPNVEQNIDPATGEPETDPATGEPIIPGNNFTMPNAREVVMVRAQYYHQLAIPGSITRLANRPNNVRLLQSSTAFKAEPFPSGCVP